MTTGIVNAEDKLYQLQVKVNGLRPIRRQNASDSVARVLDALDHDKGIVARKYFQGAQGVEYQPGQLFDPAGWGKGRIGQLAEHGYLIPEEEYLQSMAYNEAADLLNNKLTPILSTLQQARRRASQCVEQVSMKKAELLQAEHDARTAASQVEYWLKELGQAMKGEDVTAVLGG